MTRKKRFYDLLAILSRRLHSTSGRARSRPLATVVMASWGGSTMCRPRAISSISMRFSTPVALERRFPTTSTPTIPTPSSTGFEIMDSFPTPASSIVGRLATKRAAGDLSRAWPDEQQPAPAGGFNCNCNGNARRPVVPIGSFFDASRILVWPSDAPVEGDLITKRDTSDQACLVVSDLVDKYRSAPITTVTYARNRLLEYGQPALQLIRSHSTPRIAENFHQFLLSLYDSLAAAANPTELASAANPGLELGPPRDLLTGPSSRETTCSRFLRERSI